MSLSATQQTLLAYYSHPWSQCSERWDDCAVNKTSGSGAAPPPTTRPAPALASFGKVAERSFEERKLIALETIAGAAQLWI
ncbi:hypothetical protein FOMG_19201, partial [Fusarium oxysporum f. sp. melonis 26406]